MTDLTDEREQLRSTIQAAVSKGATREEVMQMLTDARDHTKMVYPQEETPL